MIPKPQRNVAQMIVDEYQATTLTETQKKLKDMEEENEKLRNDNEKLEQCLLEACIAVILLLVESCNQLSHCFVVYIVSQSLHFRLLNYC